MPRTRKVPLDRAGHALLVCTALVALASPVASQPTPEVGSNGLTLKDAVDTAVRLAPQVRLARAEAAYQWGAYLEAKGPFDLTLRATPAVSHSEGYLTAQSIADETKRRRGYYELAKAFGTMREEIAEMIEREMAGLPACPPGLVIQRDGLDERGLPVYICAPTHDAPYSADDRQRLEDDLATLFNPNVAGGSAADLLNFQRRLAETLGMDVEDFGEGLKQRGLDQTQEYYRLATEFEMRSWLNLRRRGVFPEHEWVRTASLDLSVSKLFTQGARFELAAHGEGVEDNFRGKPLDPKFGGKGIANAFRSSVDLTLTQPLLRGRGARSTGAGLRAAHRNWQAAQERFRHVLSLQVLTTAQAHFDLLAAQRSLELLGQSAETQRRMEEVTRILVDAGETARSDLRRIQARRAEVEASVAAARAQLVDAQAAVVNATGLPAEATGVLTARDQFVAAPPEIDIPAVAAGALERRHDLKAARSLREAAGALYEAADFDTKPRLDLSVRIGMAADYFGPFFRVLKDELARDENEPTESPVDFFDPRGIGRTFTDSWQPQLLVQLTWELPFGNRTARGRRARTGASLRRSEIQARDLGRVIEANVSEQVRSVAQARSELAQRRNAVQNQGITWNAARALREAGDMDLVRALLTEQDLTQAQLREIQAHRDYAVAVVRFRHETGTLVALDADGTPRVELGDLVAVIETATEASQGS